MSCSSISSFYIVAAIRRNVPDLFIFGSVESNLLRHWDRVPRMSCHFRILWSCLFRMFPIEKPNMIQMRIGHKWCHSGAIAPWKGLNLILKFRPWMPRRCQSTLMPVTCLMFRIFSILYLFMYFIDDLIISQFFILKFKSQHSSFGVAPH